MQEVDAERRIRTLRGLPYESAPQFEADPVGSTSRNENGNGFGRERKRRRVEGEDDTNRDMRLANHNQQGSLKGSDGQLIRKATSDAPLTDRVGHINLFPVEGSRHRAPKNAEAEAEAAKRKMEYEDQYTMRFSNAAGFKQAVGRNPWYHDPATAGEEQEGAVSKDVWGNEDPRRKERERMRIVADDPLAMMQKGVQGLRQVEKERKRWREERVREMKDLADAEKRRQRRKKRRGSNDDLNCFRLDAMGADGDCTRSSRAGNGKSHHRVRRRSNSIDQGSSHRHKDGVVWEAQSGGRYSRQFAHVPGSTGFNVGVED